MSREETMATLKRKIKRLEDENEGLRKMLSRSYEINSDTAIQSVVQFVRIEQAIRILKGEDQ
jgi:hypothetical protein